MKKLINLLILFVFISCSSEKKEVNLDVSNVLWYKKPANTWTEALPIGNGRLGAMIYGKTDNEIIQFNEETLWTGQPHDYSHEGAHKYLNEIRELLFAGKQQEATDLGMQHFMSEPLRQLSYQPFGNILINYPKSREITEYSRNLNLKNAITQVLYKVGNVNYKQETFSSEPDQAIVTHISSNKDKMVNLTLGMNSPHKRYTVIVEGNVIILKGKADNFSFKNKKDKERNAKVNYPESKMTFEARLKVINNNGELISGEDGIEIKNASSVTLLLVAATNFVNYNDISANPQMKCEDYLAKLEGKTYDKLKQAHVQDYQKYYNRVTVYFGNSDISERPTNERIVSFEKDLDPSLVALLYQYGRYLLISSSRPGTQPANLQGIWNHNLTPSWGSKYTLNINAEMNYWPAEITNLSELAEPFLNMVEDLSVTGRKVAKEHYNLDGWVTHHNTDIWRASAPINHANHGIWISGAAWTCQHLWWHYQFSGDKEFLKNNAYPIMKDAARFYANYLIPHKNESDWLVSGPSNSPEMGGLVMGPAMDHQIIRNLFTNTIEVAEILNVDSDFAAELKAKQSKIAPNQIGKHGQLQEWFEDKDDPENTHRHVSHLWGLHPGNEIHPLTTPELAEACKVTLSHRGDGGTGWSRAWKINFWARLLDGDHAFLLLKNLIVPAGSKKGVKHSAGGLYPNLFDAHPPFQIDGNFGATSGITEMLLQSHLRDEKGDYFQDILPALPLALSNGSIKGIKGKGGFEVSLKWTNNELVQVSIKSLLGNNLNIRYKKKLISTKTKAGETYSFTLSDF